MSKTSYVSAKDTTSKKRLILKTLNFPLFFCFRVLQVAFSIKQIYLFRFSAFTIMFTIFSFLLMLFFEN